MPRADFPQPQRVVQRQRMRDAGLVELGATTQTSSDSTRAILDDLQAGRVDAVVIGRECASA